jgi:SRSO17 transposase
MNRNILDLYTDYLICNMGLATATGLSSILDNQHSHDKITRFIGGVNGSSKQLWLNVKSSVRKIENTDDGYIIVDDTIEEKPSTDENEIVCWHHSHAKHRNVKGINIVSALIRYGDISLPIDYHIVHKTTSFQDKNGKTKYKSDVTKNEVAREFITNARRNQVKFKYVLADIWFSSNENMQHVKNLGKKFIFGIKSNRLIRFDKVWHQLSDLQISDNQVIYC